MTTLNLVSTGDDATLLGTLTLLPDGEVDYTGAAGGLFSSVRRKMRARSDAEIFAYLAVYGWSNGYTVLTNAG